MSSQQQQQNLNVSTSSQNAIESALATLQPLRDLSRNWDVDIASCLEEYLQELTGLSLERVQQHNNNQQGQQQSSKPNESSSIDDTNDNNNIPNFAQAALLVQNSSHVYSRKVEYLYSLVYKALDEFFKDNNKVGGSGNDGSTNNGRRKSKDIAIEDFHSFDPHLEFLLLDDVVPIVPPPTNNNTNQNQNQRSSSSSTLNSKIDLPLREIQRGSNDNNIDQQQSLLNNVTQLSLGNLTNNQTQRTFYQNMTTYGTGGGSSTSKTVSSSQQRALLGTLNSGILRLVDDRCNIGDNGALLMPGTTTTTTTTTITTTTTGEDLQLLNPLLEQQQKQSLSSSPNNSDTSLQPLQLDSNFIHDDDDDDEHDNDGPGFAFVDNDNDIPMDVDLQQQQQQDQAIVVVKEKRSVAFQEPLPTNNNNKKKEKIYNDPWKLLDPHSIGSSNNTNDIKKYNKPLKKGKTYRLPPGINDIPSQCVTGAGTKNIQQLQQSIKQQRNEIWNNNNRSSSSSSRSSISKQRRQQQQQKEDGTKINLATHTFRTTLRNRNNKTTTNRRESYNSIMEEEEEDDNNNKNDVNSNDNTNNNKENNNENDDDITTTNSPTTTTTTKERRSRSSTNSTNSNNNSFDYGQPNPIFLSNMNKLLFGNEFVYIAKQTARRRAAEKRELRRKQQQLEEQNNNQYDDDNIDNDDDDGYINGGYDFGGDDNDNDYDDYGNENDTDGNAGVATLDDAFKNNITTTATSNDDDNESNLGSKTFEELCRAHIEAFAKGAEEYALNTQLSDRVSQWQMKLAPKLEEEERRQAFDIHNYSSWVIELTQKELQKQCSSKRKSDGSIQSSTSLVNFGTLTKNCTQNDICRLFLASLSLANSGNLRLDNESNDITTNCYQFELLSADVERPMQTYRAPSLINTTTTTTTTDNEKKK